MSLQTLNPFFWYKKALLKYPLFTQCCTMGTLLAAGDTISQRVIEQKTQQDWNRTGKFGLLGFCCSGPMLRTWYVVLERRMGQSDKAGFLAPFKKMLVDQIIFAPTFNGVNIVVFLKLKGYTWEQSFFRLRTCYIEIMKLNYCVWPFVQMFNFYFIPFQFRLPFVAMVELIWLTYFAWRTAKEAFRKSQAAQNFEQHTSQQEQTEKQLLQKSDNQTQRETLVCSSDQKSVSEKRDRPLPALIRR